MPSRCIFSSGDEAYIPYAVVSLLGFKVHHPQDDLFILTSEVSDDIRTLCESHGIRVLSLDLSTDFYETWDYACECFLHFRGPEVLAGLGYEQSVYVDGDTFCNGLLPALGSPSEIAGVSSDTVRAFFEALEEFDRITERLPLPSDSDFDRTRLHSGVLLFDNEALARHGYYKLVADLYDLSIRHGLPRKGDDSLLALTVAAYPRLRIGTLPRSFNVIDFKRYEGRENADDDMDCVVYHFGANKPWSGEATWSDEVHLHFRQRWRDIISSCMSPSEIDRWYADLTPEAGQRSR